MSASHELERERTYLTRLYGIIDDQRREAAAMLAGLLLERQTGLQAMFERDRLSEAVEMRLRRLGTHLDGLCFGKLVEAATHATTYIGRTAISDDGGEALLVDWRAPAAEAFYRATPGDPMGMALRRHLIMNGRDLLAVEDDLLSAGAISDDEAEQLVGEAALLVALGRDRTGHMGDIVATIQRDQDQIIRSPLRGTLVVTGGPGTGKTVVALHRAAYLLYAHRARIQDNGVLVVGPSSLFLRYIERVLPSLGESSVVLLDWSELLPGIAAVPEPEPDVAALKGSLEMAQVMRRAVRMFERVPKVDARVVSPTGGTVRVATEALRRIRRDARDSGLPHNRARAHFERMVQQEVGLLDLPNAANSDASRRSVQHLCDRLWPVLPADDLLTALFANDRVLEQAAKGVLAPETHRRLLRGPEAPWTVSDLPLLDELSVLLGDPVRRKADEGAAQRAAETQDAERLLADLITANEDFGGVALGIDAIVDPAQLVARYAERQGAQSISERARRDPTWKFAHIIVDEAQDVSPMQWRALARRSQQRSMTIVGDPDQMSHSSTTPWTERITSGLEIETFEQRLLHVNYRTPAGIVRPAAELRERRGAAAPGIDTRYVRAGATPWVERCTSLDETAIRLAAERARAELGGRGRLALISSSRDAALVARAIAPLAGPGATAGANRLTEPVAGYLAGEVKGLEFDSVVVVDPQAIEDECGWRQLYVVLTRPTKHLGIVAVGPTLDDHEWFGVGQQT